MATVLSVKSLRKEYGPTLAVDNISFEVGEREIVGLLGANGVGKTTTISMILGVLEPSSGEIMIEGKNIRENRSEALERTNFAAVYAQLPGNLTVEQNLRVFGMLYRVSNLKKRIMEVLGDFNLEKFKDTKCGVLSSGEQTRVGLAKAMLNNPHLLLLDEPTASLDPATAREIRERIKAFVADKGGGVLWTSHNMHEVEEMCDRVLLMSSGKILLEGNPKTLPSMHGKKSLEELFIAVAREPLTIEGIK